MRGKTGSKHHNARKIVQLDMQGNIVAVHDSIVEAAQSIGVKSSSNISSCAIGKKPHVGGYIWRYEIGPNE